MAALQEAKFACFDDGEFAGAEVSLTGSGSESSSLPVFAIAFPPGVRSQSPKSFARARSFECTGSGSFYFQNDALKDRFVCWRVINNVVVLREWSLHVSLAHNGVRFEFPAPVVATGVYAVESWEDNSVAVSIVTHAGTIHRFAYPVPSDVNQSIFSHADPNAFPAKPATSVKCDVIGSLAADEIISVALWVNEFNLTLGTDSGRVVGVNFGLPTATSSGGEVQEFAFSDESMVKWLWQGFLRARHSDDGRRAGSSSIIAMTCFPMESEDESEENDVCLVTISADCELRAWSYSSQSCLGKQQLSSIANDSTGQSGSPDAFASHAKVVALPSSATGNCRLLVHLDTTGGYSQEIFLLRGDISPSPTGSQVDLDLDVARVFSIRSQESMETKRLKMVDFAVDKNHLFSAWRSSEGDIVYCHPNPMALTGPKLIQGESISSLDDQMLNFQDDDGDWPFDLKDEDAIAHIDDFFCERVLLPGRFSRHNLYMAAVEYVGAANFSLRPLLSQLGHQRSKYKDLLVRIVSDKWIEAVNRNGGAASRSPTEPSIIRIEIWKTVLDLCTKHWRTENVPIGFATTTNSLLPGSPVLLRRNRVSLLFPSSPTITTAFLPQGRSPGAECVRDVIAQVLPAFDAFPSRSFRSFVHREVADIVSEWKVESFVALARHCVRLGLRGGFTTPNGRTNNDGIAPEIQLTRAILQLSKIVGTDSDFHGRVFEDLVAHLFPFELWKGSGSFRPASPVRADAVEDDEDDDEDIAMTDAAAGDDLYTRRSFFCGNEICFAFDQVASRTIDEMCHQGLRVILLLSYLVDSRPSFVESSVLKKILQVHLPRAIMIYQRWELSRWIASQNITHATELDSAVSKASATLLPPLLQLFLRDVNTRVNRSTEFKRALSVLQAALLSDNVESEQAQNVLSTFTREVLRYVSQPNESLVRFLQKRKQYKLLRAMFCCNLSDVSLQSGGIKHEDGGDAIDRPMHQYVRSIGECLACEGQAAARADDKNHADWCFQQAIRCFSICLSSFYSDRYEFANTNDDSNRQSAERFIYEVVGVLKQTVPRGFFDQMLGFLWTVVTQAFNRAVESDTALQSFVWVNLFKYSVEEQLFRDAHLALTHIMELAANDGDESASMKIDNDEWHGAESTDMNTAGECASYLVKELCRYNRLDLVSDFQWGAIESDVEKQLQWQAANANVVAAGGALDRSVVMHYNLLFAFYSRRQQPANAATALYSLALRLRLARTKSAEALTAQRDALNTAIIALQSLPTQSRWIVRKFHTEELIGSVAAIEQAKGSASNPALNVVTLDDVRREIAVLDGKLRLLRVGHIESELLNSMTEDEVVALLVDSVQTCASDGWAGTLAEKRHAGTVAVELAVDIARRSSSSSTKVLSNITKSLARYCVANEYSSSASRESCDLCWEMLQLFLRAVESLPQYELAVATILDWEIQPVVPRWLYDRVAHPVRGNPAKFLMLYLQHGLLLEALQLAEESISSDVMSENEASFQKRATDSRSALPWVPYNVLDAVLEAAQFALTSGQHHDQELLDQVRQRDQRLRAKLSEYFEFVSVLEQARTAAGVAQDVALLTAGPTGSGAAISSRLFQL